MDLSISIVNWNNKDFLKRCLDSIYSETEGIKYEVIVADNNSSDGSVEMLRCDFPDVRVISNLENKGYAKANNEIIKVSKGRYILILNPDTLILDNALKKMVDFMDGRMDVGLLGCKIYTSESRNSIQPSAFRRFPTSANDLLYRIIALRLKGAFPGSRLVSRLVDFYSPFLRDSSTTQEVAHIVGAAMLVRRQVTERGILLDDSFFSFFEETDWCRRIRRDGWKIYYFPEAEIVHFYNQAWEKRADRDKIHYESFVRYLKKHHGVFSVLLCRFIHKCAGFKQSVACKRAG